MRVGDFETLSYDLRVKKCDRIVINFFIRKTYPILQLDTNYLAYVNSKKRTQKLHFVNQKFASCF